MMPQADPDRWLPHTWAHRDFRRIVSMLAVAALVVAVVTKNVTLALAALGIPLVVFNIGN